MAALIALLAIVIAPLFANVASPDIATLTATLEPLPTKNLASSSAANLEKAIAAPLATEASTTASEANLAAVTQSSCNIAVVILSLLWALCPMYESNWASVIFLLALADAS